MTTADPDDCEKMEMLLAEGGVADFQVVWRENEEGDMGVHVFYPDIRDGDTIRRAFDLLYPGPPHWAMTGRDRGES